MINFIDDLLNKITMYRLLLYYLIFLIGVALVLSFLGILSFSIPSIIVGTAFLIAVCWITNTIFAKVFDAPTNFESVYISALILVLVLTPINNPKDLIFYFWVGVWAMASKYIVAINKKHLFNPVAFSLVLASLTLTNSASWWVGTASMFPFVLVGLLIPQKTRRFSMVLYFLLSALITIYGFSLLKGTNALLITQKVFLDSPILFFAFIMLTEPQTTPPTKTLQSIYGIIVGFLFSPQIHFGNFYTTPEIALVLGNLYSYIVSPRIKRVLSLKQKLQIAPDIYDFIFNPGTKLSFVPGQYMEWTLAYHNLDSRGNRRYFTIASSPTEDDLRIGVKFYPNSSSYKKTLSNLGDQRIVAAQLAGDFTLPKDPGEKLVFIAGGIGVTPFRSMIKYLLDTNEKRDIVLFFSNKFAQDVVYTDVFDEASQKLGIKTVYTLTEIPQIPPSWKGKVGFVDENMIKTEVPDYKERIFYLSGPHGMVSAFQKTLSSMEVSSQHIKTDFFPGYT